MTLGELAERLQCRLEGDALCPITGIAGLEEAGPGDLSFVTDPRRAAHAASTRAAALVAAPDFPAPQRDPPLHWLRTGRPDLAVAAAVALLRPPWRPAPGIHPSASIHPSAVLGRNCHVGAFAAIGEDCRIGDDAVIHPHVVFYPGVEAGDRLLAHAHVVIREFTHIGHDVILQPGVVLGGDGFGFVRRADGAYVKIPQVGRVWIDDNVEIQANSCVDRASLDTTRLGRGVKVDNLVQVAHNCRLDADVLLCAQVGLAGSTVIEAGALLAGQAGVAGHCTIGKGAIVTAQSGTHGDLEPGRMVSGSPAFDHAQWLRSTAAFARLGELQREVRRLRDQVNRLAAGSPPCGS